MKKSIKRQGVILAIDQGTTGSRAILYDRHGRMIASDYQEFHQFYPKPGWVEHNPEEIWKSVQHVISGALSRAPSSSAPIVAIGITNQRETTILWNKKTGRPVYPAVVWQDRRTASLCDTLKKQGHEKKFRRKTGLVLDPYFSGTKIRWILDHVPGVRKKAQRGEILFGTIDTWLLWKLTGGKVHATDYTNASRTLLFNIRTKAWDRELLRLLKIPASILPEAKESAASFGKTAALKVLQEGIPIRAILGDQQAALYGQACYRAGDAKNTYGTGCFVMMNLGPKQRTLPFGILETLACDKSGKPVYALEGAIFIAGAAVQWLRDGLGFFKNASETEKMIRKVPDNGGVTVVPAFAGLGSPYWNPHARGMMSGLTRGTKREHIVRAVLESIAHQSADVVETMKASAHSRVSSLKVDGGATRNHFLMQFQADILGVPVLVSEISESTAWGVAKLAGKALKFWISLDAIDRRCRFRVFRPHLERSRAELLRDAWKKEVRRLLA